MIRVEGYKAFHGDMKITPAEGAFFKEPWFICDKDWLYRPDTDCWYGNGQSLPAEICEPIEKD